MTLTPASAPTSPFGAPQVAETRWLTQMHAAHGMPNAIVAHAWIDEPNSDEILSQHKQYPLVRGIRTKPVISKGPGDGVRGQPRSLQDPKWRKGLATGAAHGLARRRDAAFQPVVEAQPSRRVWCRAGSVHAGQRGRTWRGSANASAMVLGGDRSARGDGGLRRLGVARPNATARVPGANAAHCQRGERALASTPSACIFHAVREVPRAARPTSVLVESQAGAHGAVVRLQGLKAARR